ncbi:MAG: PilZ domain-containing protein [Gammaproteobacteria bacterium]
MISEKRKNRRIELSRPILMQMAKGPNVPLKCVNFSMDGVGIISKQKFEMGKRVILTINIAQQGKVRLLNFLGEVVYYSEANSVYNVGLKFFDTEIPSVYH